MPLVRFVTFVLAVFLVFATLVTLVYPGSIGRGLAIVFFVGAVICFSIDRALMHRRRETNISKR